MTQLIKHFDINAKVYQYSTGLYKYVKQHGVIIVGVYDGSTFEGSDRLSMSVMTSNKMMHNEFADNLVFVEGDRFTNSSFIEEFKPFIIRIAGNGKEGRDARGSKQTDRHIKAIETRVENIKADLVVENSTECFEYLAAWKEKIQNNLQ